VEKFRRYMVEREINKKKRLINHTIRQTRIITQVVGGKGHLNAILRNSMPVGEFSGIISEVYIQ
jgi:hypothetical protein